MLRDLPPRGGCLLINRGGAVFFLNWRRAGKEQKFLHTVLVLLVWLSIVCSIFFGQDTTEGRRIFENTVNARD